MSESGPGISVNDQRITPPAPGFEQKLPTATGGLDVEICLGQLKYPGRLPFMARRGAILGAYVPAEGEDLAAVYAAAIGFFWRGPDLGTQHWRKFHKRDVIDYGEDVMDCLLRRGVKAADIFAEGERLIGLISASVPLAEEVDEEREDFSESPPGDSEGAAEEPATESEPDEVKETPST